MNHKEQLLINRILDDIQSIISSYNTNLRTKGDVVTEIGKYLLEKRVSIAPAGSYVQWRFINDPTYRKYLGLATVDGILTFGTEDVSSWNEVEWEEVEVNGVDND